MGAFCFFFSPFLFLLFSYSMNHVFLYCNWSPVTREAYSYLESKIWIKLTLFNVCILQKNGKFQDLLLSLKQFSDTKKSFMMKNKKRKIKRTFRIWGEGYPPWNLQTGAYLEKKHFYGLWDLWSTGTLKIIGHENSQEVTCIAPTGWAHFI